jgi:hypothetical protein
VRGQQRHDPAWLVRCDITRSHGFQ